MAQMFGRYELRQLLGRGGMGEVYRAYDTEREREVALKVLPENLAGDAQFTARFRRESLLAAQLNEPHIVPIHDFGEIAGRLYIDMRLVEGEDLGSVLQRSGPMPPRVAADIVRQVASALDAAHARGLVHRDVKPSNIMLTGLASDFPFAYLVDFGIARSADQLTALTTTSSATVGTIAYMAPERINSEPFDHRADVYALACVLYETLTATLPFGGDVVGIMYAHMAKPPPRPSERLTGIPRELDDVVTRGMAKDPAQRFQTAGALGAAALAVAARTPQAAPQTHLNLAKQPPPSTTPHAASPPPQSPQPPPPPQRDPTPPFGYPPAGPTPPPDYRPPDYQQTGYRPSDYQQPDYQQAGYQQAGPTSRNPPGGPPTPPPGHQPWGAPQRPQPPRPAGNRRKAIAIAAAVVAAAALGIGIPVLAGGGSGSSAGGSGSPTPSAPTGSGSTTSSGPTFQKGGTLYYADGVVDVTSWDPQRSYIANDIANEQRLFARTLVQFGSGSGTSSYTLHPDLATDTGTSANNATEWKFTLKSGVKWQDGSTVTCDDVRYGIARSFAAEIDGGPTYAQQFLDIPIGSYKGPYLTTGQDLFDHAVECSGQKIIFHLSKPVPDFNYALTLPAFAPYKKAQDQRAKSNFTVFSDGPYKLAAPWVTGTGGTFVRNDQYDPKTDDTTIRRALPDKIVFTEGTDSDDALYARLLADSGTAPTTVTSRGAPPAVLGRAAAAGSRFTDSSSGFVYYIAPNFARLTNPAVRQALALATDRTAFITASGGASAAVPAYGLVPPLLGAAGGYKSFRAFPAPDAGDAAAAKQVLAKAGVKTPVALRLVYAPGPSSTPQAQALAAGWNKAGFRVTLLARNDKYSFVANPANGAGWEVTVTAWGPDWPSASTVLPPIFDSSVALSSSNNGADIGHYSNSLVNARISQAFTTLDATSRNAQWAALDEYLAKDVAYIPLSIPKSPRLHGSKVVNYVESASTSGYPDLGQIGVSS